MKKKWLGIFHWILTGHRVSGPVINELNTYLVECGLFCLAQASDCKSINFRSGDHHRYSKNCQLINATKKTHPQNLLADENYDHYEPLEVAFPIYGKMTWNKFIVLKDFGIGVEEWYFLKIEYFYQHYSYIPIFKVSQNLVHGGNIYSFQFHLNIHIAILNNSYS